MTVRDGWLHVYSPEQEACVPIGDLYSVVVDNRRTLLSMGVLTQLAQAGVHILLCDEKHLPCAELLPLNLHYRPLATLQKQMELTQELKDQLWQRIVIAIALSANPDILICDEPTTALDVTIQAQILELINRLKAERRLSVIFITHDLGVVANMADRIAIMYAGKIVEYGTADDVFYDPRHPYTWALLSSMPDLETKEKLEAIPGTPPDMIVPPKGDAFAPRNKYAMQIDFEEQPPMFRISETHSAATWLLHPDAPKVEPPAIVTDRIRRMQKEQAEHEAQERMMKGGAEA